MEAKTAGKTLLVRLPEGVNPKSVIRTDAAASTAPPIEDGYAKLVDLPVNSRVTLDFDLPCKIEKETVDGVEYTTTWVGEQIVTIAPRGSVSPLPY